LDGDYEKRIGLTGDGDISASDRIGLLEKKKQYSIGLTSGYTHWDRRKKLFS